MEKRMLAVVKYGHQDGDVGVAEVPEPASMRPDQVLLEVKAVGVCGSDVHLWHEKQSWPVKLPLILGHEFSVVVVEAGSQVEGFRPGDRVTCETAAEVCGRCIYCRTGSYNLCPFRVGYGNLVDGAMTRYVVARWPILHHLPDNVSFEWACLTEPICVAYNGVVEKSRVKPGEMVVIQGAGPIGIMALTIARLRGAATLIMLGTDRDARRFEVARQLGADYVVNIQRQDPVELVRSLGDGFGAGPVVDATGVSRALAQGMELVRPNGQITKLYSGEFSLVAR